MKQLALIVILIFSFVSVCSHADAKKPTKKAQIQKKSKKMTKASNKKYHAKSRKKAKYKKKGSGLDLVQLTTKSPYDENIDQPENGVNKIENEPGL
jgi:outer membrane lipoprotein-sorting protein